MMVSTRFLTTLVFLAAGLVGVGSVQQGWTKAPGWQWQAAREEAQSRRFAACLAVVDQRIKAKGHIIQRLDAGELSLVEAAAWFGYLNETPVECQDVGWRYLPGQCDGEKLCRQVICWAAPHARHKASRSQVQARLQELEEELQRHIACNGTVNLPEL